MTYKTHGMTKTKTFKSWESMKQRCTNKNAPDFKNYGGRGVYVCARWLNSFENFFADMGERPEGRSLDRIDNSKGYEPNNCRWATASEQQYNRRSVPVIEYEGRKIAVSLLAQEIGIPAKILLWRLNNSWDLDRAIRTPNRKGK